MVAGVEAYRHEEMRRVDSFCFCRYKNLVIVGVMFDVENKDNSFCNLPTKSTKYNPLINIPVYCLEGINEIGMDVKYGLLAEEQVLFEELHV